MFSLINALMLGLLPVRDPQQLVTLMEQYPGEPRGSYWSRASYEYDRDHNQVFSGLIAASEPARIDVAAESLEPERVTAQSVSGNFFSVLGLRPATGRFIENDDGAAFAVVSWSYWKNRFNLSPAILGKQLRVQDRPVTIIGVAPADFLEFRVRRADSDFDLWASDYRLTTAARDFYDA